MVQYVGLCPFYVYVVNIVLCYYKFHTASTTNILLRLYVYYISDNITFRHPSKSRQW